MKNESDYDCHWRPKPLYIAVAASKRFLAVATFPFLNVIVTSVTMLVAEGIQHLANSVLMQCRCSERRQLIEKIGPETEWIILSFINSTHQS